MLYNLIICSRRFFHEHKMSIGANCWKGNQEGEQEIEWEDELMGKWTIEGTEWIWRRLRRWSLSITFRGDRTHAQLMNSRWETKRGNIREYKRSTTSMIQWWSMFQKWHWPTRGKPKGSPFTHHHVYDACELRRLYNYKDPQDLKTYEPYNRDFNSTTLQSTSYGARQAWGRPDRVSLSAVGRKKKEVKLPPILSA